MEKSSTGLGLLEVLQIIFVVLKLLKFINWNWWIVFTPAFISLGILLLFLLIIGISDFFK